METQTVNATNPKLREFFVDQLKDIYWAEKKLVKTFPKLQEAATTPELKSAFGNHRNQTQTHVDRLEQVFGMVNVKAESKKCPAIAGIVDESVDIIDETDKGTAQRDAGLIFTGQKAEHYKIAAYGGVVPPPKNKGPYSTCDEVTRRRGGQKRREAVFTSDAVK